MRFKQPVMTTYQPYFLYIEDNLASQKVMRMILVDMLGYQNLTIIEDAQNLVENLLDDEVTYDVIFLDINLHGVYGYTICEELRQYPEFVDTKIIAVTASTSATDLYRLQMAGFNGVITKPLALDTFPQKVETILAGEELWEI